MTTYILIHQCIVESDLDHQGEWYPIKDALEFADCENNCNLPHPDIWLVFHDEQGRELQPVWDCNLQRYTSFMQTGA